MKFVITLQFLFTLLIFSSSFGQSGPFSKTEIHSIESSVLGEDREVWVYLPKSYGQNPHSKLPVMYLLDGETYFHSATGAVSHLSEVNGNAIIPDMVVVGVTNTNRNRDLTPSYDSLAWQQPTGGGPNFMAFIKEELIPFIDSAYSTAPYRIFTGHSLGGLMVIYTLFHDPDLFNAYISLDPALWWNNMNLISNCSNFLRSDKLSNKSLYLAIANSFPSTMTKEQAKMDTTNASIGYRSVINFQDSLAKYTQTSFKWTGNYYPNDGHGSVPLVGTYDGLRFVFDFYKRPSFPEITNGSAQILDDHYVNVSQKMGYPIFPPEDLIVGMAWRCRVLEKKLNWAHSFLKLGEKYYPGSANLHFEFGDWYKDKGDDKNAEKYYLKGQELQLQGGSSN